MKKISLEEFLRLRRWVLRSARPLDYTLWNYLFEGGSSEDLLSVLSAYQNADGGFGYNIECNNWNPNSSPYTTCIALDYLDIPEEEAGSVQARIVSGVLRYLASGAHMVESGWVGMQGIPSNNDYAHMPWFHYDPDKATQADIGVTKRLCDFALRYAQPGSALRQRAAALKERYSGCELALVEGYPDYDPTALDILHFDPKTWPAWLPLPVYFIASPSSPYYEPCAHAVEQNLDAIVDALQNTQEYAFASEEELAEYERNNPHPDGKRWCVAEQTVGNYYWSTHFILRDLNILRRFGRLGFSLPVCVK